jgi:hypothetical protein
MASILSAVEEEIFFILNEVRTKPASFIPVLQEYRNRFEDEFRVVIGKGTKLKTVEGTRAVDEAISFLKQQSPLNPFNTLSVGLSRYPSNCTI